MKPDRKRKLLETEPHDINLEYQKLNETGNDLD